MNTHGQAAPSSKSSAARPRDSPAAPDLPPPDHQTCAGAEHEPPKSAAPPESPQRGQTTPCCDEDGVGGPKSQEQVAAFATLTMPGAPELTGTNPRAHTLAFLSLCRHCSEGIRSVGDQQFVLFLTLAMELAMEEAELVVDAASSGGDSRRRTSSTLARLAGDPGATSS